ncbi:ran GTPase binding protein [Schizosaccharomyces japonicus yFS275]|uniref:Ran GTPase binding protein n=1 Tax=Schizosaccharomyces japonicus (strain yFS275 / FY16936) TaxID=402676 RepID=B6JYL7_SCHJY|nr:ran GTPase binding protein [Schizosaccharomyces japonicus yFS275]EEB06635.2 ran GTPase binding protein [Schizosaccharomyces japonicus yFS275]
MARTNAKETEFPIPSYLRNTNYGAVCSQKDPRTINTFDVEGDDYYRDSMMAVLIPDPLPSRWNIIESSELVESINDERELRFMGPGSGTEHDSATVLANHPIPSQAGIYYFEIEVLSRGKEGCICIGVCTEGMETGRLPGWSSASWGYHGVDGTVFSCADRGGNYGSAFTTGDVIGCCVDRVDKTVFYTKNGVSLGIAHRHVNGQLYPCVGLKSEGEHVTVNFGESPFYFNIDEYVARKKKEMFEVISEENSTPEENPRPDINVRNLVLNYLRHNGFVQTFQALSQKNGSIKSALLRRDIQDSILEGTASRAVKKINLRYPGCFTKNPDLAFCLKCAQYLDLYGNHEELSTSKNGNSATEQSPAQLQPLVEAAQELVAEFSGTLSTEDQKFLGDCVGLLACSDTENGSVAYCLSHETREALADRVNRCLLEIEGNPKSSSLEAFLKHIILISEVKSAKVHALNSLVNVKKDLFLP